jgi:hypothetical protein
LQAPIEMARGTEEEQFSLTRCDGSPAPLAVERISVMLRPGNVAKPTADLTQPAKGKKATIAPGIARIDGQLVERLGKVAEHFRKNDVALKLRVVSGYRPTSAGSYHATGRAIDFAIEGIKNEDIVAICKTLADTGCGYYPNSSFVHMDVRAPGTGHVTWIDASGPGEAPNYVSTWPPPPSPEPSNEALHEKKDSRAMIEDLLSTLDKELPKAGPEDRPAEAKGDEAPKAEIEKPLEH